MKQKFKKGDLVQIAKNLGAHMSHFTADCEAIVIGSYRDQFGGGDTKSYTLYLKDGGEVSWYEEDQLKLIESKRLDKLKEWQKASEDEKEEKGDIDWIFSHGKDVLGSAHGASVQTLASCFGLNNLWGSRGEGFVHFMNSMQTLSLATPFLKKGDKAGWLEFCKTIHIRT